MVKKDKEKRLSVYAMSIILLHTFFIILSYNIDFLSKLDMFIDPILFHRILMLSQFVPLGFVLFKKNLRESKILLFLSFAVSVSTIYLVDDFSSGFYGAMVNSESGIVPRMMTTAHIHAYKNTGHLTVLDPHGEYFLEFFNVFYLSELTGVNYIFIYALPIRIFGIVITSILFVYASKFFEHSVKRKILLPLLAGAMLLGMLSGYNYGQSFGFSLLFLLFLFLISQRKTSPQSLLSYIVVGLGVGMASFRGILVIGVATSLTFVFLMARKFGLFGRLPEVSASVSLPPLVLTLTILSWARIFVLSSGEYASGYVHVFLAQIEKIWDALVGGMNIQEMPFHSVGAIPNFVDKSIALASYLSFISLLAILGILSMVVISRRKSALLSSISSSYLIFLAIPGVSFIVEKMGYSTAIIDFASSTAMVRLLSPIMVVVASISIFKTAGSEGKIRNSSLIQNKYKTYAILFVVFFILAVFAPFAFNTSSVKSSYDESNQVGRNEIVIHANNLYYFVNSKIEEKSIRVGSCRFLRLWYSLPFKHMADLNYTEGQVKARNQVYSGGIYSISYTNQYIGIYKLESRRK